MEARFDRLEMMLGQQAELAERCFAEIRATLYRRDLDPGKTRPNFDVLEWLGDVLAAEEETR